MVFLFVFQSAAGAVLELAGSTSSIEMNNARMSVSCPSSLTSTPAVMSIQASPSKTNLITASLFDVATNCAGVPLSAPCVELSVNAPRPPMFTCTIAGETTLPATQATLDEHRSSMGELLSVGAYVACDITSITTSFPMTVSISFNGTPLPFIGPSSSTSVRMSLTVSGTVVTLVGFEPTCHIPANLRRPTAFATLSLSCVWLNFVRF